VSVSQFIRLLFISAIWGASHVFSRVVVPVIGPEFTVFGRVVIAFVTLSLFLAKGGELRRAFHQLREYRVEYFVVGLFNMALPFLLFAFATVSLPASYLVILNATVPIFNALLSTCFMRERFDGRRWASIALGIVGVVLLTEYGSIVDITPRIALSLVFGLLASASYGVGTLYIRMRCQRIPPAVLVWGSNLTAVFLLAGFAIYALLTQSGFHPTPYSAWQVGGALLMLGAFSSGVAFVMFYRLVAEIGAFNASLSTFVMPMFGLIWGVLLLGETVTWGMIAGAGMVIGSAALFVRRR
jgi:drug/metabolite transporter (DMT)-like permease